MVISKKIGSVTHRVVILDSYLLLNRSQADLCKIFEVDSLKTPFPYKFMHENNLRYVGNTPAISYYKDISRESRDAMFSNHWSFRDESIKYLENSYHLVL